MQPTRPSYLQESWTSPKSPTRSPRSDDKAMPEPPPPQTPKPTTTRDDQTVEPEITTHVDYLAHEWKGEEIWSSRRYVLRRRGLLTDGARLENVLWRTWPMDMHRLAKTSPETLKWLKDADVTWLYGPLQTDAVAIQEVDLSLLLPPPLPLSARRSSIRKRLPSAVFLERYGSRSPQLQAQPNTSDLIPPSLGSINDYSALKTDPVPDEYNLQTANRNMDQLQASLSAMFDQDPDPAILKAYKHVLFDEEVGQARALESKPLGDDDDDGGESADDGNDDDGDEDSDSDDGMVMAPTHRRAGSFPLSYVASPSLWTRPTSIMRLPSTSLN